jgi:hypothetical protein
VMRVVVCYGGLLVGRCILCVGDVCGVRGVGCYGDLFVVSCVLCVDNVWGERGGLFWCSFVGSLKFDRKVHCCSRKVLTVTDGSQKNLTLCLAETGEVKNVNSQKYPFNSQGTQKQLHYADCNVG